MEMTENEKKKAFLRRYRECERREQEILEEIQRLRMENPNEQRVLRLRYLWGLGWEAIGEKMGYSREGAIKLHGRALPNLKFLKEYTPVHSNL